MQEKNQDVTTAVIYARFSCDKQTEQSIEGQLRECNAYAALHGITVVGTYIDRAQSGRYDDRDQFQKMIADSGRARFNAVIVYKTDRFARNRYDSAKYKAILKKNGVRVLYAKEAIPEGPEGIILESMLEGMAEYYSAELSQKVNRGMHETALKCRVTGSLPYGYTADREKHYQIDEAAAPLVKTIFAMYDEGKPVKKICEYLNGIGAKTATGRPFQFSSVHAILKNEKYTGLYSYNDVKIEGGIPQMIEKEQFERVQKRINQNKRMPAKTKGVDYLLTGKLYCGECDGGMCGESGTGRAGVPHYYYVCRTHKKNAKSCALKRIRKDVLESFVTDETVKHILAPGKIELIAKQCADFYENECAENPQLKMLEARLAETQKSLGNLMKAIEQGIISRHTQQRLSELEKEEEQIKFEIAAMPENHGRLKQCHIECLLNNFMQPDGCATEEYKRNIIDCFISSVYVYNNKIVLTYNLTGADGKLEKSELQAALDSSDLQRIGTPDRSRTYAPGSGGRCSIH